MNLLVAVTQTVFFIPAGMFAQVEYSYSSQRQAPGPLFWICDVAVTVLIVVAMWKIFSKAGQPGWAAIIPIYNLFVWCKIVGRPAWWILLLLICFPIFYIILCIDLAKALAKESALRSA